MNRRGFLKLLGWSVPLAYAFNALPVDGFDEILYDPIRPAVPGLGTPAIDVVDFETATRRVAEAMRRHMAYPVVSLASEDECRVGGTVRVPSEAEYRVGSVALISSGHPITLTDQIRTHRLDDSIGRVSPGGVILASVLDEYGVALAEEASERKLNAFAPMILPKGLAEAVNVRLVDGPTVRGVMVYDLSRDDMLYRFDVLGGRA